MERAPIRPSPKHSVNGSIRPGQGIMVALSRPHLDSRTGEERGEREGGREGERERERDANIHVHAVTQTQLYTGTVYGDTV